MRNGKMKHPGAKYQAAFAGLPENERETIKALHEKEARAMDAEFDTQRTEALRGHVRSIVSDLAETPWKKTPGEVEEFLSSKRTERTLPSTVAENSEAFPFLLRRIENLGMTVRTTNRLKEEGIRFVGDLARKTEAELSYVPKLGKGSLGEIREALRSHGLGLGTEVEGWRSPNNPFLNRPVADLALIPHTETCLRKLGAEFV